MLRIRRWQRRESINVHWPVMVEKSIVSCPMRMWAKIAKENGTTRATASMDKAATLDKKLIFAIGNAPTALVRLYELIEDGKLQSGTDHWSSGWICECCTIERTDHGFGSTLYSCERT